MIILLSWCVFTRKFMYLKQILRSFTKFENGFGCEFKCKNIFGTFCTFMDTNDVVYTFFFCPPKQVHVEKRDYSTDTDGHKM